MNRKFSHTQVEHRVKALIAEITGYEETLLTLETRLMVDESAEKALNIGSLELAELLISIDEEFEVNIPDEEFTKFTTLQSLVDYIVVHIE